MVSRKTQLILGMIFGNVVVQVGPGTETFATMLASPRERARKVNVLHVLPHIDALAARFTAEDTAVVAAAIVAFLNVGVQIFYTICNRRKNLLI